MSSSAKNSVRITSLHYNKRRDGADVEVQLDNGVMLALDADLVVRFQLKTGTELSEEELERLQREQERITARRRLIRYVALRRKTARQCEQYLARLTFTPDAVEYAISAARELGYINDELYAEIYTRTQQRSARKGPHAIRHELRGQGVDEQLAKRVVAPLEDRDLQRERARELAAKKIPGLRKEQPTKARLKLYQFLLRKGYDSEICMEIAREVLVEDEEEE